MRGGRLGAAPRQSPLSTTTPGGAIPLVPALMDSAGICNHNLPSLAAGYPAAVPTRPLGQGGAALPAVAVTRLQSHPRHPNRHEMWPSACASFTSMRAQTAFSLANIPSYLAGVGGRDVSEDCCEAGKEFDA